MIQDGYAHATVVELLLPPYVGSGDYTRVIGWTWQVLLSWSHLTSSTELDFLSMERYAGEFSQLDSNEESLERGTAFS